MNSKLKKTDKYKNEVENEPNYNFKYVNESLNQLLLEMTSRD